MKSKWNKLRFSPIATVFIVFVAMFLDGALLTTVVPIIPAIIKEIKMNNQEWIWPSTVIINSI